MTKPEKPELGSTEAAVLSCVDLIARATQTDEEYLAYWLDLYYQLRSRHETETTPRDISELMVKVEAPDPVIVKLDELGDKIQAGMEILSRYFFEICERLAAPPGASAPTEDLNEKLAKGVGPAVDGEMVPETADGSKKKTDPPEL